MRHDLPKYIRDNYEVHQWRHALAILQADFPQEYEDIVDVLTRFRLRKSWIAVGGGRKSKVADWIDGELLKHGWRPKNFDTKIIVDDNAVESPTHEVDCFKNRVALEIEWNNKDPFFDRDLNNFRLLFDLRVISVGVIITRCDELQQVFEELHRGKSYGASTTHMSKLLLAYRAAGERAARSSCSASGGHSMTRIADVPQRSAAEDLLSKVSGLFATILADPPWQFQNRTGKMAPEHKRLLRYPTMEFEEILDLPVRRLAAARSHLYLWVPNALLAEGLEVMRRWGFTYKTNLIWYKVRKDGGPDGRGVGFYFRNVTEMILFGVRGSMRTLAPGRTQVNLLATRKREHSRKPDEIYDIVEACSPGPYLELFARFPRRNWTQWGNEDVEQNSIYGVGMRNGHTDPQLRLFQPPRCYSAG